ncbi:MAG TPA: peroxiredoxin [Syntrophales bacterium]|nr:peroxiredoxin [Syntrophales bacterium]
MKQKKHVQQLITFCTMVAFLAGAPLSAWAISDAYKENIYNTGVLKPRDSKLKVKVGQRAPDFTLPAIGGEKITLSQYRGKKNVMLTFIPAAWTPVCSDQWPGYNIVEDLFTTHDTIILGISVDNLPTLFSWTNQMGRLWFPVLSDFWPHGQVAKRYGILRSDGTAERAIFIIDKKGVIRYIDVHNINERPPLEGIVRELEKLP